MCRVIRRERNADQYGGARPRRHVKVRSRVLNVVMRLLTESQCSSMSMGVTWSYVIRIIAFTSDIKATGRIVEVT